MCIEQKEVLIKRLENIIASNHIEGIIMDEETYNWFLLTIEEEWSNEDRINHLKNKWHKKEAVR